jgi:hypothetical protein
MSEQLAISDRPYTPPGVEPGPNSHETKPVAWDFADPNAISQAHNADGIWEGTVESEVSYGDGDVRSYTSDRSTANLRGAMGRNAEGEDGEVDDPERSRSIPMSAGDVFRALSKVMEGQRLKEPGAIYTGEQLRLSYSDRLRAIVTAGSAPESPEAQAAVPDLMDPKGAYAGAKLEELEYLCQLAKADRIRSPQGNITLPTLEDLRVLYSQDTEYQSQQPGGIGALLTRGSEAARVDALNASLYAEAATYYSDQELQKNGYRMASPDVLNQLIEAARAARTNDAGEASVPELKPYTVELLQATAPRKVWQSSQIRRGIAAAQRARSTGDTAGANGADANGPLVGAGRY